MITHRPTSLADQIFERLENDILSGVYPKGTVLTELSLCEELGVSRTPVREVLKRLAQEHIVEDCGRGMLVLSITPKDAEIIYEIREKIEGMAASACARNISDEDIAALKEIVDLQDFYAQRNDSEKVKSLDSQFHQKAPERPPSRPMSTAPCWTLLLHGIRKLPERPCLTMCTAQNYV